MQIVLLALLFTQAQTNIPPTPPEGILPVSADGKPLNLDFETGTLKDWQAEGDAFLGQPIKGDTVFPRRKDSKSQHQGNYWIGGFESRGDKPQGTLTSVPFKVTHPWGSFLVGGGAFPVTCVELVQKDTGMVFQRAFGLEAENMLREVVDLQPLMGKEIFIRLVDKHSGGWGHINFDDFRFHAQKPSFPPRPVKKQPLPADVYKYAGLPPQKAAEVMTVPEGFQVKLFAGEPDVFQPIAFCLDDRGRVWVAEAYSYPIRRADKDAKDRIVIFEDTDGDGVFDKRTVFMEGLNLISGLEVGHGGVWIGAAPYFMFVPMKDDKPSGPKQILLDGWAYQDTHETLNTFTWGPDGWLYGCHGVFTHSKVGKPGTPDAERSPSTPAFGAIIPPSMSSKSLRRAPAIRGAWISMIVARPFARPASFRTVFTSFRAHAISGRRGSTSMSSLSPTFLPSPIIAIIWAPRRTAAMNVPTRPAAAMPTAAP